MPEETTTTTPESTTPAPAAAATPAAPEATAPASVETGKAARRAQAQEIVERHKAAEAGGTADEATPAKPAAAEASDEGASPEVKGPVKDPDTGKFVSHDEAVRRGLVPAPDAANDGAAAEGETQAEAAAGLVVKGPDRAGDGFEEITLPEDLDDKTRNAIHRWAKSGMRKAEFDRQLASLERDRGEVDQFKGLMVDAPEVILPRFLPAESKAAVALALLQDADVYKTVSETIEEWELDPAQREKARADRMENERKAEKRLERQRALRQHYDELESAIESMVPEGADDKLADRFLRDAFRDVEDTIKQRKRLVTVAELPTLLADRVEVLKRAARAGANTPDSPSNGSARPAADGARPGSRTASGSADPAKLRRLTTAPVGAGVPANLGESVPKDIKLGKAGTGALLRKRFGLGRR